MCHERHYHIELNGGMLVYNFQNETCMSTRLSKEYEPSGANSRTPIKINQSE